MRGVYVVVKLLGVGVAIMIACDVLLLAGYFALGRNMQTPRLTAVYIATLVLEMCSTGVVAYRSLDPASGLVRVALTSTVTLFLGAICAAAGLIVLFSLQERGS